MKRLYRVHFDADAVQSLALHVSLVDEEVGKQAAAIWETDVMSLDAVREEALNRAVEHLRPRLKEFLSVWPVDGVCL